VVDILIIGGTRFLGRFLTQEGIKRKHEITLFNRGKTNPHLFPDIEKLHGDRDGGLEPLKGRRWDLVIDVCGYVPRIVEQSAKLLKDQAGKYLFVSTMIVYDDLNKIDLKENDRLASMGEDTDEEVTTESYGPLKGDCERVVKRYFPENNLMIRPGVIIGPEDNTDRFTYWVNRIGKGGRFLAPGNPDDPVQVIDVRDLVSWIYDIIEKNGTGAYNATGPDYKLTMGELFEECQEVAGVPAEPVWVDSEFLLEQDVVPWRDIPLWRRGGHHQKGFMRIDSTKAIKEGLTYRPLRESIRDVLDFARSRGDDYEWTAGLDPDKEKEILEKWEKELETVER